jgi:hypothetical protein
MAIEYRKKLAVLTDMVSVEDAEPLLGWAQKGKDLKVDLSGCSHLHPASLQVLLAAGAQVTAWPTEPALARWLQTILPGR